MAAGVSEVGEVGRERQSLKSSTTGRLPLSHRLSIVYLTVPVFIWLVGWFEWWVGFPVAVLLGSGLWRALAGSWKMSVSLPVLIALLSALAWVLLTPYSGLWQASGDLEGHLAVILDIGRGGWPTYLTDFWSGNPPLLRYYLGIHLVPGLVGRWLGSAALSWAFPLWICLGIGLLVVIFIRGVSNLRGSLLAILVLIFFSGMNALEFIPQRGLKTTLEILMGVGDHEALSYFISAPLFGRVLPGFQSNSVTLWWSPQHVISSGLVALIIIQSRHHLRFAAVIGIVISVGLFWSPAGILGLLPLAIALIVQKGVRPFLTWPNLLVAPLLVGLIFLYFFSNDQPAMNFGWLWQYYADHSLMLIDLIWLYITELVVLIFLLYQMDRRIIKDTIFIASLAVLSVLPWFLYNPEVWLRVDGDAARPYHIMTRGAVPALVVLAYFTSRVVLGCRSEVVGGTTTVSRPRRPNFLVLRASLIAVLAIGALSPLSIFLRSNNHPDNIYEQVERTSLIHTSPKYLDPLTVTNVQGMFQTVLRKHDRKGLSLGAPIIRSKIYDIYLYRPDNMLIYLNRNCIPESEKNTRFFLHIYPTDGTVLPVDRIQAGYEIKDSRWGYYPQGNNTCFALFGLPKYGISRIVAGQYTPHLGIHWALGHRFDGQLQTAVDLNQNADPADYYYSYHQLAIANESIISSDFDVYLLELHQNTMIYIKDNCTSPASQAPIFLHIFPADENDLPVQRRQVGFDNYDFVFNDWGVTFDNKCLAVVPIPDYDIAAIRTGQWNPADGSRLWQEEVALDP